MRCTVSRVGFIGLGDVGLPMAKRIVSGGFQTIVCGHLRRLPVEEMLKLGATEVGSPKEVGRNSDATIIMVPDDKQAEQVIFGPDGLLRGTRRGHGFLLMGTYSPAFCKEVAAAANPKRIDVFDAPVVGARMGAKEGTLSIIVGGDKKALERYKHVLERLGRVTYCGPVGMGQIVKLANNMAAIVNARIAFEAVAWGMRNGASEELLVNLMKNGSGTSFAVQNWEWIKSMMADPPPPTYSAGTKDLGYALEIARELDLDCPIAALTYELAAIGAPKLPHPSRVTERLGGPSEQPYEAAMAAASLERCAPRRRAVSHRPNGKDGIGRTPPT
jgi:3-hydroxyisobutyrate dehydrogenase